MISSIKKSIIIPCYNEAENIPHLLKRYNQILEGCNDIEVVLVNDGSKDESQKILEEQKKYFSFLNVVNIYPNQGYGNAVFAGLKEAKGDLIGWTHGDMQTPPEDIIKAFSFFSKADDKLYVKGRRYGRPFFDIIFTFCMSIFETVLFTTTLVDINAQPNVFRKSFLEKWNNPPKDFSLDLYVYLLAKRSGYHIIRFPVFFGKRFAGVSSWNTSWKNKYKFIKRTINFSIYLKKNSYFNKQ